MTKIRKTSGQGKSIVFLLLGLAALSVVLAVLLRGNDIALLNPKGQIAQDQTNLFYFTIGLLLAIATPTVLLLYYFAWRYRESSNKAIYSPHTHTTKFVTFCMWAVPFAFMVVLALVMLPNTQKLEPQKQIASDKKPLTVQVVALRWKWLFIYPEQKIATVNYVQIPVDTPVEFELTADETPMSSFWIPHLAGQLYAMTGHVNRLNLVADTPGDYPGSTAEINGHGFAGMKFVARASSEADFNQWIRETQFSRNALSADEYTKLVQPSENNPQAFYGMVDANLYDKMLMKYNGAHGHTTEGQSTNTNSSGH